MPQQQTESLTILLWNVAMTPSPPPHIGTRQAKERAPQIAKVIAPYDVVVLNECFIYRQTFLDCVSANQSHPYVYIEPRTWYKFFNSGVVILSKVPLTNLNFKHYSKGAIWDWFTSKGLIGCSFKIGDVTVDLYGTHLQAGAQNCAHHARASQTQEIVDQVQLTHDPSHELIVCGDFNCGPVYDVTQRFSVHYVDASDAVLRNAQYQTMVNGLKLTPLLEIPSEDDICSFLVKRNSPLIRYKRLSIEQHDALSDTASLAMEISLMDKLTDKAPVQLPHECHPL